MQKRSINIVLIAVFAALVIVTASLWISKGDSQEAAVVQATPPKSGAESIRLVRPEDHVLGKPTAPLTFIVYSDFECPYCKEYHKTLRRLVELYGRDGEVAIVYRHMPIVKLHPHSPTYALAAECVAAEGGEPAFWEFSDILYASTSPDRHITSDELVELAGVVGVDQRSFAECMNTSDHMARIEEDFNEALDAGASATPFTVVVTPFQHVTLQGNQPFTMLAGMVKAVLRNLGDHIDMGTSTEMQNFFEESATDKTGGTTIPQDTTFEGE